jgi:hypothetical protein
VFLRRDRRDGSDRMYCYRDRSVGFIMDERNRYRRYANAEKSGTFGGSCVTMDGGGKGGGGGWEERPVNADDGRSRKKCRCKKIFREKEEKRIINLWFILMTPYPDNTSLVLDPSHTIPCHAIMYCTKILYKKSNSRSCDWRD